MSDLDKWQAAVGGIELRSWRYPMEISVNVASELWLKMDVEDREKPGETKRICFLEFLPQWQGEEHAAQVVFSAMRKFMEHELQEAFHYKGKRCFDPHKGET